jgi:HTH-type transcriptional regulator/antitoxin MqsA
MSKIFKSETCPICDVGTWVPRADDVHTFKHKGRELRVTGLHYALCNHCGARGFIPGQIAENKRLVATYQLGLRDFVSPSNILELREKYQISQVQAAAIFSAGKTAFSKWERGLVQPTGPTAVLLKAALSDAGVMKKLAKEAGVSVALPIEPQPAAKFNANVSAGDLEMAWVMTKMLASFATGAKASGTRHAVKAPFNQPMAGEGCFENDETSVPEELLWQSVKNRNPHGLN